MPVPHFTLIPMLDWTTPPARPKAKRPPKRKAKPKAAPAASRCRMPRPKLSPQCRSILIDRLEAAIEDGRIELCDEEMPCTSLDFTLEELAFLQRILFPEDYHETRKVKRPTRDTAPGSAGRIEVYAERHAAGTAITAPGDVGAVRGDGKQLKIAERKNGSGVRVVGWEDGD